MPESKLPADTSRDSLPAPPKRGADALVPQAGVGAAGQRHQRPSHLSLPRDRWAEFNLFRNPFGELTRSERAALAVVDLDAIVDAIRHDSNKQQSPRFVPFRAYQIIGPCGRGKTTRLLAVARRFPTASYVYLPEDQPCPAIPIGEPLLIDEAQRLPRCVRRTVFSSGAPLVLATHRDLSVPLRRARYAVTSERIGRTLSVTQLTNILNRRIEASRRDPNQPSPVVEEGIAAELIRRFGTDVRGIESYLYDIVQSQEHRHGEMRFID